MTCRNTSRRNPFRLSGPPLRGGIGSQQTLRVLQSLVAASFTVPARELRSATRRSASIALARQSAMYLAHVALGLSYAEVGRVFRRDRTTAAHACRVVEERRDNPAFDAALCLLEAAIARPDGHAVPRVRGRQ